MKTSIYASSIRTATLALAGIMALSSGSATAQSANTQNDVVNPFSPAAGHAYRHGAVPTREAHASMKSWAVANRSATRLTAATGTQTLAYGGGVNGIGVTSGTPRVYLVVLGTQWGSASTDASGNMTLSGDTVGAVPYLQNLFKNLGTGGELWSGVMTQYCDGPLVAAGATTCPAGAPHVGYPTGGALAGIWYDNSASSPTSATAAQLANEAIKAAAHFGNTTAASNRYVQYVILSPSGTTPDGFNTASGNFCAWHDYTADAGVTSPYGDIAFTNMPYVYDAGSSCGLGSVNGATTAQGKLDGFSIVEGHEYAETVTDQNPAGGWTNKTGSASNGQENGDECAWVTTGAQAATQNVTMGTGTFAMQSTWSNDTNACNISHPIVTGSGGGSPNCDQGIANGASLSCTAAGLSGYMGTAYSQVYTTYSGGGSCTKAAAPGYNTSACVPPSSSLTNGVAVNGITLATGASTVYTFTVPSGQTSLTFDTSGGTGDSDLYVQLGSAPTTTSYLQKSDGSTTTEHIVISNPVAGTYYVLVYGYNAPSGVTLVAKYSASSGGTAMANGVPITGLSGAAGSSKIYTLVVPAGRPSVTFKTSGGTGDSDLYLQLGTAPTTSSYLNRSIGSTTTESINITSPAAGTYYVLVYGYAAFSGVTLVGSD
ncbi:serine protease [Undibacterium sp. GrIS 1.2]|uniref:PPC domain-containing protein n=1 Tax=Undibacterium sp. GrIS 1.2 TaxID=3143933 RepID=UPI003391059F